MIGEAKYWVNLGRKGVVKLIGLYKRVFRGFGSVAKKVVATFRAVQGREATRLGWGERINDDILDPIGMLTGAATISVPFAGPVPGHFAQHFLQPLWMIFLSIGVVQGVPPCRPKYPGNL